MGSDGVMAFFQVTEFGKGMGRSTTANLDLPGLKHLASSQNNPSLGLTSSRRQDFLYRVYS